MDFEKLSTDLTIALLSAFVGAIAGYFLTLRLERRKRELEQMQGVYNACLELRKTLSNWMNEIADATAMEKDVPHVLARLRRLWEHEHFERDISTQLYMLDGEPLCANLLKKTAIFHRQVFEVKGQMTMALTIGSLARDYENHRSVALNSLKLLYENFDQELNNVIPQLKAKARL